MRHVAAASLICAASTTVAQTELVIHVDADRQVVQPGESVNYTIWAELLEPEHEVLAVIQYFGFNLEFGNTDLNITDNEFQSTFDNDFFGPADDGDVIGDSIVEALGINEIPPLNNPDGPDSSNPLQIYSFSVTVPSDTGFGSYTPMLSLWGEVTGAYVGWPFPIIITYQSVFSDVPYRVEADTIYVPTPAVSLALVCTGLIAARRKR